MPKIIGMPDEVAFASVHITGNRSFTVSNFRGIIECSDTKIRVNTPDFVVTVSGMDFEVNYISSEDISVKGIISSVDFVS